MGISPGDRQHDDEEAVFPQVARELGEGRRHPGLYAEVSGGGVVGFSTFSFGLA